MSRREDTRNGYEILVSKYTDVQIADMARTIINSSNGIRVSEESTFWNFVLELQASGFKGLSCIALAERTVSYYAMSRLVGMN